MNKTIYLPDKMAKEVDLISSLQGTSFSNVVQIALDSYIEKEYPLRAFEEFELLLKGMDLNGLEDFVKEERAKEAWKQSKKWD